VFAEDKAVVSADKTSVVSADKTSVASADKTSVVSADKTSVVSQEIPIPLATQPRCGCLLNIIGMSWETTEVLSADTTDVLSADTTDVLSADTTDVLSADTTALSSANTRNPKPKSLSLAGSKMESGHHLPLVRALEGVRHGSDDSFSQRSFIGVCRGLGTPWMRRKVKFEIGLFFFFGGGGEGSDLGRHFGPGTFWPKIEAQKTWFCLEIIFS